MVFIRKDGGVFHGSVSLLESMSQNFFWFFFELPKHCRCDPACPWGSYMPSSPSIGAPPKCFACFFPPRIDVFFCRSRFCQFSQGILKPATPEIETGSDRHRDPWPRTCEREFWLGNDQSSSNLENDQSELKFSQWGKGELSCIIFSTCWQILNEKDLKVMMKEDKKTWQDMISKFWASIYLIICYNIRSRCDVLIQSKVLHPPTKKYLQKTYHGDINLETPTNQQHLPRDSRTPGRGLRMAPQQGYQTSWFSLLSSPLVK